MFMPFISLFYVILHVDIAIWVTGECCTCIFFSCWRISSNSARVFFSAAISWTLSRCSLLTPLYMSSRSFISFWSFIAFLYIYQIDYLSSQISTTLFNTVYSTYQLQHFIQLMSLKRKCTPTRKTSHNQHAVLKWNHMCIVYILIC